MQMICLRLNKFFDEIMVFTACVDTNRDEIKVYSRIPSKLTRSIVSAIGTITLP